jgi:hypothetical protein
MKEACPRMLFVLSLLTLMQIAGPACYSADSTAPKAARASAAPPARPLPPELPPIPPPAYSVHLSLYKDKLETVQTQFGEVSLPSDSAVYVVNTAKSTALFILDEKHKGDVQVKVKDKMITAAAGDEILLSRSAKETFSDLAPKLGIPFRSVKEGEQIDGVRVFKAEFLLEKAFQHIPGVQELASSTDPKKQKILRRLLKNAAVLQPTAMTDFQSQKNIASIHEDTRPINSPFTHFLVGNVEQTDTAQVKGKVIDLTVDAAYSSQDADVQLLKESTFQWCALKGNDMTDLQNKHLVSAIVLCSQGCTLKTDLSTISCKRGSKVFIDNRGSLMTVCALDGDAPNDVVIKPIGMQAFGLMPGKVVAIRKHGPSNQDGPARFISYRAWSDKLTSGETDFYGGEFSLMSALFAIEPLRDMCQSKDPHLRAQARSVIKTATILAQINPTGTYELQK